MKHERPEPRERSMSLKALRIANFKAFGDAQRVPLRPVTLLYGANSAGKSSVLHALALAHHAVETGELNVHRTRIGGDSIDLGGFGQYVHRRQRDQEVTLAFRLAPSSLSGKLREALGAALEAEVEVGIGMESRESGGRVGVQRFAIASDGQELLAMSKRQDQSLRLDRANHAHPIFRELVKALLALSTAVRVRGEDDLATPTGVLDKLLPGLATWRGSGLFVRALEERALDQDRSNPQASSRGHRGENLEGTTGRLLEDVLRDLVGGLVGAAEREIDKLRYLGPLRSCPPRRLAFAQHQDSNWRAGGGHAWDVVRTHHEVRERVNEWLGDPDRLKTPYELQVQELLPAGELEAHLARLFGGKLDAFAELKKALEEGSLHEVDYLIEPYLDSEFDPEDESRFEAEAEVEAAMAAVDAIHDADGVAREWVRMIREIAKARDDIPAELVLVDKRSSTSVSHRDVGIGVSQVLPVLVAAFASKDKWIAIEQPEIHLHPALQAELGDVFLESALGEAGNRFLIETHSEHLMLRILRRIRETSEGDLPPGATPVRPDDVAVLYVQPGPDGAEIVHLPTTADGDFAHPWPDGFFDEREEELF